MMIEMPQGRIVCLSSSHALRGAADLLRRFGTDVVEFVSTAHKQGGRTGSAAAGQVIALDPCRPEAIGIVALAAQQADIIVNGFGGPFGAAVIAACGKVPRLIEIQYQDTAVGLPGPADEADAFSIVLSLVGGSGFADCTWRPVSADPLGRPDHSWLELERLGFAATQIRGFAAEGVIA
jgi:hypothetical protein